MPYPEFVDWMYYLQSYPVLPVEDIMSARAYQVHCSKKLAPQDLYFCEHLRRPQSAEAWFAIHAVKKREPR